MKRFKFNLLIILCLFMPFIFSQKAYADAVVINFKRSSSCPGHMSVISQDENGKWFYFYWGNKASYEKEVPANYMKNIDTFNEWLYKVRKIENQMPFSDGYFIFGTYIKGDFTKTTEYYRNEIKNYKKSKYSLFFNNCAVVSKKALEKGVLNNGKSFKSQIKHRLRNYIPFWDNHPDNYRKTIEKSFVGTEHQAHPSWGIVTDEKIKKLMLEKALPSRIINASHSLKSKIQKREKHVNLKENERKTKLL